MKESEAARLIAMLAAYWRTDVPDETVALWSNRLVEFDVEDGMEAAHILGESGRFFPPLTDFVGIIRECRNDRILRQRMSLPRPSVPQAGGLSSFAEYLNRNPDMAERVKALTAEPDKPVPAFLIHILKAGL